MLTIIFKMRLTVASELSRFWPNVRHKPAQMLVNNVAYKKCVFNNRFMLVNFKDTYF